MTARSAKKPPATHGHTPPRLLEPLLRGFRLALVLTAVTQILHACNFQALSRFDHAFTTAVVSRLLQPEAIEARSEKRHDLMAVQQIEVGADLRVLHMEAQQTDADTVRRLDGIRPIDRAAMAALLQQLAKCLAEPTCLAPDAHPKVLAIDVDLAPLPKDESSLPEMIAALQALRRHVEVVAIVLDRSDDEQRRARNAFMRTAECTQQKDLTAPNSHAHGLYFASSRLLQRAGSGPLYYLDEAKSQHEAIAPRFPSLGMLAYLATGPKTFSDNDRASLTNLCEQAHSNKTKLTEDHMLAADAPGLVVRELEHQYRTRYFNWTLLHSEALRYLPLRSIDEQQAWTKQLQAQLQDLQLQAPILVLNIDGGAGNDRFQTPGALMAPVSGATLHALQALSLQQSLHAATLSGALADLVLGLICVLAGCLIHVYLLHALHQRLPGLTRLLLAGISLLLALGFSALGVMLAGWLMVQCRLWFNPLYVVLGMALHAFIEGWTSAEADGQDHDKPAPGAMALVTQVFLRAAPPHEQAWDARLRLASYWLLMLFGIVALWISAHH